MSLVLNCSQQFYFNFVKIFNSSLKNARREEVAKYPCSINDFNEKRFREVVRNKGNHSFVYKLPVSFAAGKRGPSA